MSKTKNLFSALAILAAGTTGLLAISNVLHINGVPEPQGTVNIAILADPGPIPDVQYGSPDAPITIVEYFSHTCSHCADFHTGAFREIGKRYVDTGKVRFLSRDFPVDPLAIAGAIVTKCSKDRVKEATDLLLENQREWIYSDNPGEKLRELAEKIGVPKDRFNACLNDQDLMNKIVAKRDRGREAFGIEATPTFFINGKKYVGALTAKQFDAILTPLLDERKTSHSK